MRTWKQGRIGKIEFSDSSFLFIKCLRYPIAQFFERYNEENQILESLVFEVLIQKFVLPYIEIIGQQTLTKEDRGVIKTWALEESKMNKSIKEEDQMKIESKDILDIEKIQKMYRQRLK